MLPIFNYCWEFEIFVYYESYIYTKSLEIDLSLNTKFIYALCNLNAQSKVSFAQSFSAARF